VPPMARARRTSASTRRNRLTLAGLARILGVSTYRARKTVARFGYVADPRGNPPTFDPRIVDFIRATRGQPHRELEEVQRDWLTRYQEGNP